MLRSKWSDEENKKKEKSKLKIKLWGKWKYTQI